MKQARLDQLADGIFAIAMTLLIFNLKIPVLASPVTDKALWAALMANLPLLLSFIISFALLFTYWRGHHYIVSIYAKNIDINLTTINAIFFFFIALVPFSGQLLGTYSQTPVATLIFGINVILIGLSLYVMKKYVIRSSTIEINTMTPRDDKNGDIRILLPVVIAAIAIVVGFYNTTASFVLFTFSIVFNLIPSSTSWVTVIADFVFRHKHDASL